MLLNPPPGQPEIELRSFVGWWRLSFQEHGTNPELGRYLIHIDRATLLEGTWTGSRTPRSRP